MAREPAATSRGGPSPRGGVNFSCSLPGILWGSHVALCINRVVIAPIRNGAAGDAHLETLAVGQRKLVMSRHSSNGNANPRAVHVGWLLSHVTPSSCP